MNESNRSDVTEMLSKVTDGDFDALGFLMPRVYDELHEIAGRHLRRERPDHTLNATALVNEAYLKLVDQRDVRWQNRAHFRAIASQAMRRILVNHAAKRGAQKRGGGEEFATLNEELVPGASTAEDIVRLDAALDRLRQLSERQSKVVEYRFFGGLTHQETAEVLGVSIETVNLDWRLARAWLSGELKSS